MSRASPKGRAELGPGLPEKMAGAVFSGPGISGPGGAGAVRALPAPGYGGADPFGPPAGAWPGGLDGPLRGGPILPAPGPPAGPELPGGAGGSLRGSWWFHRMKADRLPELTEGVARRLRGQR